jgi:hypothetical protein
VFALKTVKVTVLVDNLCCFLEQIAFQVMHFLHIFRRQRWTEMKCLEWVERDAFQEALGCVTCSQHYVLPCVLIHITKYLYILHLRHLAF